MIRYILTAWDSYNNRHYIGQLLTLRNTMIAYRELIHDHMTGFSLEIWVLGIRIRRITL